MTVDEAALWAKITKFQFDEIGTQFTFAKRLSRENGWPEVYTSRVITDTRGSCSYAAYRQMVLHRPTR